MSLLIDIHSHILPHIDDGTRYIQRSITSLARAAQNGVTHVIVTPHHGYKNYHNPREKILDATLRLRLRAKKERIPILIFPGQEVLIHEDMMNGLNTGALCTLADAGQYLLVSLPQNTIPSFAMKELSELQRHGVVPVLAHPERHPLIRKDPSWLYTLVQQGIVTQITAPSLLGYSGRRVKRFAIDLIKHDLAHFIASDTHGVGQDRYRMKEAYAIVERHCGTNKAVLLKDNSDLLMHCQHILRSEPRVLHTRRGLLNGFA